jgi:hypothetical protein
MPITSIVTVTGCVPLPCCTIICSSGYVSVAVNYDGDLVGYNSFSSGGTPQPESSPISNTNTCGSFELGSGGTVTLTRSGINLDVTIAGISPCLGASLTGLNGSFTATPLGAGTWSAAVGSATFDGGSGNGTLIISCTPAP